MVAALFLTKRRVAVFQTCTNEPQEDPKLEQPVPIPENTRTSIF